MIKPVFIIAEAGVNHNGSFDLAIKLIDAAAQAGADSIKFQTFKTENLVSRQAKKAAYQSENTSDTDNSQLSMLKKLEIPAEWYPKLINQCKSKNILFLSTPFDEESVDLLDSLSIPVFKIPSGEITNTPLLEHIGKKQKPVILSTGMSTIDEINTALSIIIRAGTPKEKITVLHCTTEYPTPMNDVNLRAMLTIHTRLGVEVGYSDHTQGIEVPIAAVALGARVIEKHFTLNRNLEGPDHKASLEPDELTEMVKAIRNIEMAMGDGIKQPSRSEMKNMEVVRKSVHSRLAYNKGHTIGAEDLIMLRPGNGIPATEIESLIGKKLMRDIPEGHLLKWEDLL